MATNRADALQVVDPLLTEIARRYQSRGFIYNRLVSDIAVSTITGTYVVYDDQYWFSDDTETLIQDRAPSREVDFEWSTATYRTRKHGLKVGFTADEVEQAGSMGAFDLEADKTEYLGHRMQMAAERRLAALLLPSGDGGGLDASATSTPSNNWDVDAATIEADIKTGVLWIYDQIGIRPTRIVIPFKVAYAMALQADVRDILAHQISGGDRNFIELGDRVLPSVIHGMSVVIPEGTQVDTANEGGTPSKSEVWSDHVRLLYVNEGAGRFNPSVVKRFVRVRPTIKRWDENDPDITYIRHIEEHDEKVVAPKAGYVLKSVLS